MKKIVYLFPTNRQKLIDEVKNGTFPDNSLYGYNHLQKFFQLKQAETPANLERILNILFSPVVWIFNSRYTKLNLGRAILALPQFWQADAVVTCVDSVNKAAALLKKLNLFSAQLICMAGNVMDGTEKFSGLHQWLWSGTDRIITHASVDQEKLVRLELGDRGVIIPVGSDDRFWQSVSCKVSDTLQTIVSVGADRDRDYQALFSAAAQLPRLKFLVCCGQKSVEGLKIPENVKIRINVSPTETKKILSDAELVVLPLRETFRASGQLALLDAMLMGKPVMISKTRGTIEPYGLKDEKNALLVPAGNVESLVQAIEKLKNNGDLRRELGNVGRKLALGYTTESYAEKLKKIIFTSSRRS
jgi:glycosyltransferase involved in cell wall biosynthesis